MPTYQTVLTASGRAKLAAAVSSQIPVVLMVGAVGDGNGSVPGVLDTRTELVNEVWRGDLASVLVDPTDVSKVQAGILIPAEDGGFTIRELGIYDSSGDLFAYGSFAPSYKSRISEGMGSVKTIQTIFTVTSSEYITFDVAPSTESASKSYVDASVAALRTTLLSAMRTDDAAVKDFARKLVDAVFPVGYKLEWPASSPPPVIEGIIFLKQNGGSFDTLSYPKLAAIFPDGKEIFSNPQFVSTATAPGASLRSYKASSGILIDPATQRWETPRTSSETRMKNTAYNFIVRAA